MKPRNIPTSESKFRLPVACKTVSTYKNNMLVCNCSTRVMEIQSTMSERAIELLNLPPDVPAFILDIGCGSGLSGECLTEQGHYWVGVDIAPAMLSELLPKQ